MIVALNNKSNLTKNDYKLYLEELSSIKTNHKMILCPTFLNLNSTNIENVRLGAQNVSATKDGPSTGEISAHQLKSYNVEYCIVGHSERRENQRESFEEISIKVRNLFDENIIPILCVGETLKERKSNSTKNIITAEITSAIINLSEEEKNKLIVAYEPIWSIGTGIIPTNEEIEEIFLLIKTHLPNAKILYGGSANENNIETLRQIKLIDGYLLGGLSLKPSNLNSFLSKLEN